MPVPLLKNNLKVSHSSALPSLIALLPLLVLLGERPDEALDAETANGILTGCRFTRGLRPLPVRYVWAFFSVFPGRLFPEDLDDGGCFAAAGAPEVFPGASWAAGPGGQAVFLATAQ